MTLLQEAHDILHGDRQKQYGNARDTFAAASAIATAMLGKPISAEDACIVMIAVKLARESKKPKHDSRVDAAAYLEILDTMRG